MLLLLAAIFVAATLTLLVADVGGYPTVTHRTMTDLAKEHRTEVVFENVEYDVGLEEDLFTERSLRRPPNKWIR